MQTPTKGISIKWFVGMTEQEKEDFASLLRSNLVLRRFKQLLLDLDRQQENQETNQADYDNSSWAYKQADRNGYRRAIKDLKELLTFVEI